MNLAHYYFDSKPVVVVDSVLTTAIFARYKRLEDGKLHRPQVLALDFTLDKAEEHIIREIYELKVKPKLLARSMSPERAPLLGLAKAVYEVSPTIQKCGENSVGLIAWWLKAHTDLISQRGAVKLSTITLGPQKQKGFAVHSIRAIPKHEEILELVGLMPMDNDTNNTRLSEVASASGQVYGPGQKRILFGPSRFVNHLCKSYNAEFVSVNDSPAFLIYALRDIAPNEEITINYGDDYFPSEEGGCPCFDCKPPNASINLPPTSVISDTVEPVQVKQLSPKRAHVQRSAATEKGKDYQGRRNSRNNKRRADKRRAGKSAVKNPNSVIVFPGSSSCSF